MQPKITQLSFEEFENRMKQIMSDAKKLRPAYLNESKREKIFSSIDELDKYYHSSDLETYIKEIQSKYGI